MTTEILHPSDREYAAWLGDVERHVMLPLKWVLLLLCLVYWMWCREWMLPGTALFGLMIFFAGVTLGEHYFFARDRITPRQVQPFVYASFLFDMLFAGGLVLLDTFDQPLAERIVISDFTVLFIILVLRGFALFRTRTENILSFICLSALFLITGWLQITNVPLTEFRSAISRLAFIWGIMLLMQAFVGLVNSRKKEEFRMRERLIRSESLASLGELAAGVAHEINNPIGIIKTYCDFLTQSTSEDDPLREDFQTIHSEAERCQEIVHRMLDFSNPQVGELGSISMETVTREIVSFVFMDGAEETFIVDVSVPDPVPPVRGDEVQLKQAVLNVLINARQILTEFITGDAMPEGFKPRLEITLARGTGPRPPVRLTVRDNGPGISAADAERAFEPFFTRRRKGTGLGLAITRRIIEAHNGSIRLAPHPDGGTVVTIELPIEGEEQA